MAKVKGWPDGSPAAGINFYRAGEVSVLLQASDERVETLRRERDWTPLHAALLQFFHDIGHPLAKDAFDRPRDHPASERDREPLVLQRRQGDGRDTYIFQTVTLENCPSTDTHDVDQLGPAIASVVAVIKAVNDERPNRETVRRAKQSLANAGFQVVGATPNWLGMPFHD